VHLQINTIQLSYRPQLPQHHCSAYRVYVDDTGSNLPTHTSTTQLLVGQTLPGRYYDRSKFGRRRCLRTSCTSDGMYFEIGKNHIHLTVIIRLDGQTVDDGAAPPFVVVTKQQQ
jgi:hypothetical protein